MKTLDLYRMSPLEQAFGWIPGRSAPPEGPIHQPSEPLAALEEIFLDILRRTSCFVLFSGGRDSSALLAVGVDVARRHGLQPPVPVTWRFPSHEATDEDPWQEIVVRSLGITEWFRVDMGDRVELLGEIGTESLRRYGLVWPAGHFWVVPALDSIRGGTIVYGQGGDEVLGPRRVTPLARLLRGGPALRRAPRQAALAIAPRAIRRERYRIQSRAGGKRVWLRPAAHDAFVDAVTDDLLAEPLRWDSSVRAELTKRVTQATLHNRHLLSVDRGIRYVSPLLDRRFVEALASAGGRLGFPDRTSAMRYLFGALLPEETVRRPSKVAFNTLAVGPATREFIEQWNGSGVDPELVDPERLKEVWQSERPNGGSYILLQAAWLAQQTSQPGRA